MTADMVNNPPHYTTGKIEVIDFIEDQRFGYLSGQVVKYVSRYRHKGKPVEDLQKAQFYLARLIKTAERAAPVVTIQQEAETTPVQATQATEAVQQRVPVTPFDVLKGQIVVAVEIGDRDLYLRITTNDAMYVWEAVGDCCSSSYFNEFIGLGTLTYEPVVSVRAIPMAESDEEANGNYTQLYGYQFLTRLGTSLLVFRNESNGYYGGWLQLIEREPKGVTWRVLYGNEWRA